MNREVIPADHAAVAAFSNETTLVLVTLISWGVLAVYYTLAVEVRTHTRLHELKLRVAQLQSDYAERLKKASEFENNDSDVIVLNEVPLHAAPQGKKAA